MNDRNILGKTAKGKTFRLPAIESRSPSTFTTVLNYVPRYDKVPVLGVHAFLASTLHLHVTATQLHYPIRKKAACTLQPLCLQTVTTNENL